MCIELVNRLRAMISSNVFLSWQFFPFSMRFKTASVTLWSFAFRLVVRRMIRCDVKCYDDYPNKQKKKRKKYRTIHSSNAFIYVHTINSLIRVDCGCWSRLLGISTNQCTTDTLFNRSWIKFDSRICCSYFRGVGRLSFVFHSVFTLSSLAVVTYFRRIFLRRHNSNGDFSRLYWFGTHALSLHTHIHICLISIYNTHTHSTAK